ncbi:MAG: hypothetical protein B6D41_15780 [Chloroflexi bacterium UTCFX4]|nr:MAG: hypothetical protein B6D41_15780 [Chloroflexi bacterium UTCFX4]
MTARCGARKGNGEKQQRSALGRAMRLANQGEHTMYIDELYQKERYADMLREAEHESQVRAAKAAQRHKSFYKSALIAVGVKLVALGNRLQDNVETVTPVQMLPTSECA